MTAVQTPLRADQISLIRNELLRSLNKLERSLKISGESARPLRQISESARDFAARPRACDQAPQTCRSARTPA